MTECPTCKKPMGSVGDGFEYKCKSCDRVWTHAEIMETHWTESQRRIVRVELSDEALRIFAITKPPDNQVLSIEGIPETARLIATTFDPTTLWTNLFFEDDSFAPVLEGSTPPVVRIKVHRHPIFPIPEEHLEQLCGELDDLDWDRKDNCKAIWVLLNKLKKAIGRSPDLFEEVSWKSLNDKEDE